MSPSRMIFTPTGIPGAWIIDPAPIRDARGYFARTFCEREFGEHGAETRYPQHSMSFNARRGTLRGLHFQHPPHAETKLVSCMTGEIFDVCVDLRPDSPTYRRWIGQKLSAENGRQLLIPEGCAHGFQTLTDNAQVRYMISAFYSPDASGGVRFDDPVLGIQWPLPVTEISDRDRTWPALAP